MSEFDFENARWNIPLIGGTVANIGRVIDLVDMPCNPTPEIWVKAAWSNVPFLIWDLAKPDLGDVVVGAARHGRRQARKARTGAFLRDRGSRPGLIGKIEWATFKIVAASEKIGFFFHVVDVTENFVINWISTAYTYAGCVTPGAPWATMDETPGERVLVGDGSWQTVSFDNIAANILGVDGRLIAVPGGIAVSVACAINFGQANRPEEQQGAIQGVRIIRDDAFGTHIVGEDDTPLGAGGVQRGRLAAKDFRNTGVSATYRVQVFVTKVGFILDGGSHFDASGDEVKGVFLDP